MEATLSEYATGDLIAQRLQDFQANLVATFGHLERQVGQKFDIREQLDSMTRTKDGRLWLLCLAVAVLVGVTSGVASAYLG